MIRRRGALVSSAVLAVVVYVLMWIAIALPWKWIEVVDQSALDTFYRFGTAHPGWVTGWDVFCTVLGPGAFRLTTLIVIVVALVKRRFPLAVFLVVCVELSGLVTEAAKASVNRARPDTAFVSAWSTSFPSGHALGVMVAVLAWLTVVLPAVRRQRRGWLVALGVLVVVTIGIGRVVLNVHHPSDVLAGWAAGYAYFVLCLLVASPRRPISAADETPAAPDTAQ
ncbi:phosphatase PAP2 family protein [Mycobacterium deserti]|uniref:phosphatase PAP2 family protein n=1 Tax=Mycobacterium deserti TaxID=2978347 RepID=UPI0036F348AF